MSRFRIRPSFANVTAFMALFIALGGAAYAAGTINGKSIVDHSITGKDIKVGSIPLTALKKVPDGKTGPAGPVGKTGPAGPAGAAGAPGTARAYGWTADNEGNLFAAKSKNATVRHDEKGVYCITPGAGIDPSTATLLVSPDFAKSGSSSMVAQVRSDNPECNPGELVVRLWKDSTNAGFTEAIDAQFSFLIP